MRWSAREARPRPGNSANSKLVDFQPILLNYGQKLQEFGETYLGNWRNCKVCRATGRQVPFNVPMAVSSCQWIVAMNNRQAQPRNTVQRYKFFFYYSINRRNLLLVKTRCPRNVAQPSQNYENLSRIHFVNSQLCLNSE
jgi:hypothetical protein